MKVHPLFYFYDQKKNIKYNISVGITSGFMVGHLWEATPEGGKSGGYVGALSIPLEDLKRVVGFSYITRDAYAVLYNDWDGYEAWELTLFDSDKNPIVVPVIVLNGVGTYVVEDLTQALGQLKRLHIRWGEFIHSLDYEYPTLWGTETDHWTFEMVTPALYKITKNGKRYSLTDDPYGTSSMEAIYRHLYKVYRPLETI